MRERQVESLGASKSSRSHAWIKKETGYGPKHTVGRSSEVQLPDMVLG